MAAPQGSYKLPMLWVHFMRGVTNVFRVCSEISAEMGADVVLTSPFLGVISSTRMVDP